MRVIARHAGKVCQGLLHLLGAQAGVANRGIATLRVRAHGRALCPVAADVTAEFLLVAMIGERNAAVRTSGDVAARADIATSWNSRAGSETESPVPSFEPLGDGLVKLRRKNRGDFPFFASSARISTTRTSGIFLSSARSGISSSVYLPFEHCRSSPVKAWRSRARPPRLPFGRA